MQPGNIMCFLNFYTLVFWIPLVPILAIHPGEPFPFYNLQFEIKQFTICITPQQSLNLCCWLTPSMSTYFSLIGS